MARKDKIIYFLSLYRKKFADPLDYNTNLAQCLTWFHICPRGILKQPQ